MKKEFLIFYQAMLLLVQALRSGSLKGPWRCWDLVGLGQAEDGLTHTPSLQRIMIINNDDNDYYLWITWHGPIIISLMLWSNPYSKKRWLKLNYLSMVTKQISQKPGIGFPSVWFPKLSSEQCCHPSGQMTSSKSGNGLEIDQMGSLLPRWGEKRKREKSGK